MLHASLLAADVFSQEQWIREMFANEVDAIHVDIIDPSVADFAGVDARVTEKLSQMKIPFVVHYMAKWNDALIHYIDDQNPMKIFFHESGIENLELFFQLNAGVALELGKNPTFDVDEYILMNVPLGSCNQQFQNTNIQLSYDLKKLGKKITSDGGLNLTNLNQVSHFDHIVVGGALHNHSAKELKIAWKKHVI